MPCEKRGPSVTRTGSHLVVQRASLCALATLGTIPARAPALLLMPTTAVAPTLAPVQLLCSNLAAGAIIGREGCNRDVLMAISGARVQLSRPNEFYPATEDRVLVGRVGGGTAVFCTSETRRAKSSLSMSPGFLIVTACTTAASAPCSSHLTRTPS